MPRQTAVIGASLPPDLVSALRAHAAANDRSFSGELRQAIRRHLAAEEMSPVTVATVPGSKIAGQGDHAKA